MWFWLRRLQDGFRGYEKYLKKMKIDKKLIKELVENLKEFNLTELEYQEGQTKK